MRIGSLRLLAAVCIFHCFAAAQAGVNTWTTQGPPGMTSFGAMVASPTDPDVFYAGVGRVLARSVDGAVTWQSVGGIAGQVVNVAVDPADGRRLYVGVVDQGLFRSEDGGDTFTLISPPLITPWGIGVGGPDGRVVYYATGSGTFFRSSDRGNTFVQRTSTFQTMDRIFVEGADGNTIVGLRGPNLARSTDGGMNWLPETTIGGGAWLYTYLRLSPTLVLMGTSDGIYVSQDDGANWIRRAVGSAPSLVRDPHQPNTLYAGFYWSDRVWRSTDAGQFWSPIGASLLVDARGLVVRANGSGRRLVAASFPGMMYSENEGTTWTESAQGPVASSPYRMATTVAANSRVLAFDTGSLHSSSMGSDWQRIDLRGAQALAGGTTFGQVALALKPGDPQTIYLLPFGQPLLVSTNGGANWSVRGAALQNLSAPTMTIDPVDTATMYAVTYSSIGSPAASLYRSTDSGASWAPHSNSTLPSIFPISIVVDPANRNRLFLGAYQGTAQNTAGLYRSTDGGVNWTERGFLGSNVRNVVIDSANPNRVYAATAQGLQVSDNGGDSFTRNASLTLISALSAGTVALDPTVPDTVYAATVDPNAGALNSQGSTIARSVDRGATWEVLRAANDPVPWYVGDILLDPNLPSLLYVNTGSRGIGTFEIQNDLSVTLSGHSGTKPVGAVSNYSARIGNHGALAATAVGVDLTMPAGLTAVTATPTAGSCVVTGGSPRCVIPVLRPGTTVDIAVSYTPPGPLALPVSAQVSAHERDGTTSNNSAQASALAGEVVDLRVTATPSATTVDRGDAVSYTLQITNAGPVTASVAAVAFVAGPGFTLGTAPAGCTGAGNQITCVYNGLATGASRSVTISGTADVIGTISANAAVAAAPSASDMDTSNNSATSVITARAVADLSVTATDSADPVLAGGAFNYVVEVRNTGPDEMPAVTATISSAGAPVGVTTTRGTCTSTGSGVSCALGALASGATATITIPTTVAAAGTNTLGVTVAGSGSDRAAGNNTVQQATVINAPPAPPGGGGGKKGGGGALDLLGLIALAASLTWRRRGIPARTFPRS